MTSHSRSHVLGSGPVGLCDLIGKGLLTHLVSFGCVTSFKDFKALQSITEQQAFCYQGDLVNYLDLKESTIEQRHTKAASGQRITGIYTPRVHARGACFTTYLRLRFWGPWAHLGFEKKRPQSLNKRPTKAWGTNRNGVDVKLLSISRKTSKAPVANHNGLDAKLLRSSWKTTKAWVANHNGLDAKLLRSSWKTTKAGVANHNGLDAKLLRMSLKIQAKKKILFLLFFEAFS